ncbi:hypothetical protein [Thiococcus pfennigii]|uniref:hypothetical protein n=1 Tax=Thiococcus pfennigii TaxID=1057 RepID=UPI00190472DE|nr:hypothetical protein [Thiococcus pfennigii]MBK1701736.1 hypothetical protein [Thiococcus pfennigii]MBK1731232.1 hypothetical protein [Thiococcus pfennigii]
MTYTLEEFIRETHREVIAHLTPEERRAIVEGMPPQERLRGLLPEERLRGLPLKDRLRDLDPDALPELTPEEREALRKLLVRRN